MTAEEVFSDLFDKYGDNFNWHMVPLTQAGGTFVNELKKEIGQNHFLYDKKIWAVAKCDSNDDVLYVIGDESGSDSYYIFHLTYSEQNAEGFPKYEKFANINAVKVFIEQAYINNYM